MGHTFWKGNIEDRVKLLPSTFLNYCVQGCALMAPGRLRRLTFSFGRLKKSSRSPGWALLLLMQCSVKQEEKFNILVLAC